MSLQIWLPLNGTLVNNGLHTAQISSVGAALGTTSGKVTSSVYNWTADGQGVSLNGFMNTFRTYRTYSISAWVYYSSQATNHSTSICSSGNWNTGPGQLCFGLYSHNGTGYTRLLVPNTVSWDWGIDLPSPVVANTWYHIAAVYDGTITKGYVNGEYIGSLSVGGITSQSEVSDLHIGRATYYEGFTIKGCINDFRLYDHALSKKEIKEISKGLRVHYQLKSPRVVNLAANYAQMIYDNFGVSSSIYATGEYFMGQPVYRLTMTPNSSCINSYINDMHSHGIYQGIFSFSAYTKYCYWVYYRPVSHNDVRVGGVASNKHGWTEIAPKYFGDGWYRVGQYRDGSVASDASDYIYTSFTTPTAAVGVPITIDFCAPHLISGVSEIVETFGIDTMSAVERDVSGYENHAIINGSISAEPKSPRYDNSYYIQGNSYIVPPSMSFAGMANSYTISYWAKIGDMDNKMVWGFADGNRLNVYPSSWFNWNTGNGANNPFMSNGSNVSFSPYNGSWHHYAITGNGSKTTLYIDGIERGTAKNYVGLTGTQIIISGWDTSASYKWSYGNISDYRIYATCLAAEDITNLCKVGAAVSKDGTVFGYDFDGLNSDIKSSVTKDGISTACLTDRDCPAADMEIKILPDESVWAKIYDLDVRYDQTYFKDAAEVAKCLTKNNRYSRMGDVDKFKSKPSLPNGYTELEYIESNGSQFIDAGFAAPDGCIMEFGWSFNSIGGYIIGSHDLADPYGRAYVNVQSGNQWVVGTGDSDLYTYNYPSIDVKYDIKASTIKGDSYINIDGVLVASSADRSKRADSNQYLFSNYYLEHYGYAGARGIGKMYYAKFYLPNGSMVRNFVPCRNQNGAVGMYDLIENKFYNNSGSGEFAAGEFVNKYEFMLTYPEISSTPNLHLLPDGYTEMNHIESDGAQFIDLGVSPTLDLEVEIAFTPTGGLTENAIFGSSWAANGYFLMFYQNKIRWHSGGSSVDIGSYSAGDKVVCRCTNSYIVVNGTYYPISGGANTASNIQLLGDMGYNSNKKGIGKIEYVKIWKGAKLIRNFIPCKDPSTNVGLYDLVEHKFYNNSGTGAFIAGEFKYNRWTQTSSPNSGTVAGYIPVHISWPEHSAGLRAHNPSGTCIYNCDTGGTWYAPIGQLDHGSWNGAGSMIPAANGVNTSRTQLWIRVDKSSESAQFKIYDGSIVAKDYIEI